MPHYFFHLNDPSETVADDEGRALDDLAAARAVALEEARALISADALTGRISLRSSIAVLDERGATLHTLPFASAIEIVHSAQA